MITMPTFHELLDESVFLAYEKQRRLSSLIGEHQWHLDVQHSRVRFNDDLMFDVQFVGTESTLTNTWLWADANDDATFPERALRQCRNVRAKGGAYGIQEFIQDTFPFVEELGRPTGHTLAMVTTCLIAASCYYRGPYEHGAIYFTLNDERIDSQPDLDLEGFRAVFAEQIWIPGDMKKRVISYLSAKGYVPQDFTTSELTCQLYTGEKIRFSFKTAADGRTEITFNASVSAGDPYK